MNSRSSLKKSNEEIGFPKSLALSLAVFVLLTMLIWSVAHTLNFYREYHEPALNAVFLNAQIGLAVLSSVLIIILLAQYLENFLRFKTQFTMALVIMALVLLAHSITSNPLFFSYFGYWPMEGPFSIIPLIFTTLAAMALLYLNSR